LCRFYQNDNLIVIIRLLIEQGIDINWKNENEDNALTLLCRYYQNENLIDIIRLLIENGIDINWKNEDGDDALTVLCNNYKNENLIDITKFLIKSGFNVTKETRDYFQRNYDEENRNDVLRLLNPPTKGLRNVSWCYLF
jgi:ankyrin repeat protein